MTTTQQPIDLGYRPRPWQALVHKDQSRFKVLVIHRRGGKTTACIMELVDLAVRATHPRARFAYIAPFRRQAKDVAWDILKGYATKIPGATIHESELRADLPNGARITLYGADNFDGMRGIYLHHAVLDEFGDMDPRVWPEVIRPALSDHRGGAIIIGTPKGRNHFAEVFERDDVLPGRFAFRLRASESGLLPADELASARAAMTEDQYLQEFECSFDAAVRGAYYAKLIEQAEVDGRVCRVPHDPGALVWTAWDLGVRDTTVIWFAQVIGREVRIIDYLEDHGHGLEHYVKALDARPYRYGGHILPHDVQVRELGAPEARTRLETLRSLGLRNDIALPQTRVEDGINAVRMFLPMCVFDKDKTARGVECLRMYRVEWDEKLKTSKNRPLHDWSSHAADAFRYLAEGLPRTPRSTTPLITGVDRGSGSWMTI